MNTLMKLAEAKDRDLVIDILAKSFQTNRSVNYVIKQDENKDTRIRKLMDYSFRVCHSFGEVWLSDDRQACALLLLPKRKKTTLKSILWDVKLAFSVIGINRVLRVMEREGLIKKNYPSSQMCYLWFIGVNPEEQSKGTGSNLLQWILERYDRLNIPVYLETSVERNIPWYKKFGFEIYNSLELTYTLYLLKRVPNNN